MGAAYPFSTIHFGVLECWEFSHLGLPLRHLSLQPFLSH